MSKIYPKKRKWYNSICLVWSELHNWKIFKAHLPAVVAQREKTWKKLFQPGYEMTNQYENNLFSADPEKSSSSLIH